MRRRNHRKFAGRRFVTSKPSGRRGEVQPGFKSDRTCLRLRGNPCSSKLVFLLPASAKKLGTEPGPNLVYCAGEKKPGKYIPVKSAAEATALGKKFCACVRSGGRDAKACIVSTLAAYRRKHGRK